MAALIPILEGAAKVAPAVLGGISLASHLADRYAPKVKKLANHVFNSNIRKSATQYIKGLASAKGLKKFVTKDIGKAVKGVSKVIKSGDLLKGVQGVAGDIGKVGSLVSDVSGGKYGSGISELGQNVHNGAQYYHDVASEYEKKGSDFVNDIKKAARPAKS